MNEDIVKIKEKLSLESVQAAFEKNSTELSAITDFNFFAGALYVRGGLYCIGFIIIF